MKKKIFYGWWIVLSTNIICMLGYGTWLYSFGVFFKPMAAEFGWTRAMTAGAYSLRSIEGGIASPIVGWAVDKYGSRGVIVVGAVVSPPVATPESPPGAPPAGMRDAASEAPLPPLEQAIIRANIHGSVTAAVCSFTQSGPLRP